MAGERFDYKTLRPILDPDFGRIAYNEGEGIMAQVVEDYGLEVGVDVEPARANSMPRPARNASRAEWAKYALIQGLDPEEVDGLTRDELRDHPDLADNSAEGAEPAKGE